MRTQTPPRARIVASISLIALASILLSGCATSNTSAITPTDMQTKAASSRTLPDHIVNGDFEYPAIPSNKWETLGKEYGYGFGKKYKTVNPDTRTWGAGFNSAVNMKEEIPGWDGSEFAWSSTQQAVSGFYAHNVEINYDTDSNQCGEITADQAGTAIYQDVATEPGTVYTWSLKHTSTLSSFADSMQVLIGKPGDEAAQQATRISSQNGNEIGWSGTTITTHTISSDVNTKKWDTYTGVYHIPDGQTITRFTFKAIKSHDPANGNNVDDISFQISRPLSYDPNGGSGKVPNK